MNIRFPVLCKDYFKIILKYIFFSMYISHTISDSPPTIPFNFYIFRVFSIIFFMTFKL